VTAGLTVASPAGVMLGLLPELVLTAWSLVLLLVLAWKHDTQEDSIRVGYLSLVGIVLAAGAMTWLALTGPVGGAPEGSFAVDAFRWSGDALLLLVAAFTTLLSLRWLGRQRLLAPEYYVLVLFAVVGMMLMVAATDLLVLFLGLELMSISVYVLAGFDRFRRSSAEAALKYFLIGAFATGFLLYGIALTYGATGTTNLAGIAQVLATGQAPRMAGLGLGLLLIGFAFKVAAVPFHMWAPDVYDGAPTPITGFMATGVKSAAFLALIRLLMQGFPALSTLWQPVLGVLAVITIIVGNVVALAQQSLKRMLAYSSIAHAGYLLAAVWCGSALGSGAVLLYLAAYCLTTLACFGILLSIERVGSRTVLIDDLEGLFSVRPWAALSMSVCLMSLLGFPGTFGFIGKWHVISAALSEGQVILPIAVVFGSAISIGYYLRVIMAMTLKPTRTREAHKQVLFSPAAKAMIATAVALNLLFGVWPTKMMDLAGAGAQALVTGVGTVVARN
jgi:NADH-quinone oxidoreductase subunit N